MSRPLINASRRSKTTNILDTSDWSIDKIKRILKIGDIVSFMTHRGHHGMCKVHRIDNGARPPITLEYMIDSELFHLYIKYGDIKKIHLTDIKSYQPHLLSYIGRGGMAHFHTI